MVKAPDCSQVQYPYWETYKLKDVFSFLQNNTLSREHLNDTGGRLQNIHYGDILVKYGNIVDCSVCAIPFVNDNISAKIKSSLLQDGDIIMADTAEDETVGKTCEILGIGDCAVVSGLHTFPMRPKKRLFKKGFLGYYFNSRYYHNQIIPYITGIKVSSISRSSVKETRVLCPPLSEQQAIAEALSDIDRLIAFTEKLIAKKKAIKQGLMQELLTGKRRLPGFSEKWETISLDKILSFETTTIPATLFSPSRYIATENMISGGGILPNELTIPYTKVRAYQEKDILISNIRPYLRKIWFSDTIGGCSNDVLVLRAKKNFSALFVFYSLCRDSFFDFMMEHARGTKMPRGDKEALKTYKINVPKDPKEQEKIANMLEACQAEISGRSAELQKFKQIKQGMMSELLTGRIRMLNGQAAESNESTTQVVSVPKQNHNEQFDDAVLISAIVNKFFSPQYYLGRKKVQKLLYLARRHQNASTDGFLKKAAGPYKPSARYRGGEAIAIRSGYITEIKSDKGSSFAPGEKMPVALDYAEQWNLTSTIEWLLQNFQYTKVDDLEVLATVDMAICDLKLSGQPITLKSVKDVIRSNKEWVDKFNRPYFIDRNIQTAMRKSQDLYQGRDTNA